MLRLALLAAVASLALIPAGSGAVTGGYCDPGDPPPQPVQGSLSITSEGVTNHVVAVGAGFQDQRPYKSGSLHFEITGPDGTITPPPEPSGADERGGVVHFTPKTAGRYTAKATNTYVECVHSEDGSEVLVTDTAGPKEFVIVAERDPTRYKIASGSVPRKGLRPSTAGFQVEVQCAEDMTTQPLTTTLYYELGTKVPTHASRHVTGVTLRGCGGGSAGKDRHQSRSGKLWLAVTEINFARFTLTAPQTARLLVETTRGSKVLIAARALLKYSGGREHLIRDSTPCAGTPNGCQTFAPKNHQ